MLIKITNFCSLGCSHCMENSTVAGTHMTEETFLKALGFTRRIEAMAWSAGCPPTLLISGGECTEHPDIVRYIEIVMNQGFFPILLTNGMWLGDKELRESILRPEWNRMLIQVTNDPRFYPKAPPAWDDPRIRFIPQLTVLLPLGRAPRKKDMAVRTGIMPKNAPSSFNIRSLTRSYRSVDRALVDIRIRAVQGKAGHCIPTVSSNGDVVAGESNLCFKVGTVDSTNDEITKALIGMECNKCGLVGNLTLEQKRAIGASTLYGDYE